MTRTLADVIKACEERYMLKVTPKNKQTYVSFLQRQLKAHPDYDLNFEKSRGQFPSPYLNLLVDKLLILSYLLGQTPIIAGYRDETGYNTYETRIKNVKHLYLLRRAEMGYGSNNVHASKKRTDERLFRLAGRIEARKQKLKLIGWAEIIDELGNDWAVKRYFGQKITYNMVRTCRSPNPLTSDHGGFRWGKKSKPLS
jgi:hypothetical protein